MIKSVVKLKGTSPLSFSKHITEAMPEGEKPEVYEAKHWRERSHYDEKGIMYIPNMMIKNAISAAAKYANIKIPGERNATFTKNFEAGVYVATPICLNVHKDEVEGESVFVPSDGKRGGTTRVTRCFPLIRRWEGETTIEIYDNKITKDVFDRILRVAGIFIGLGRFRPRNNGCYGRFTPEILTWEENDIEIEVG